MVDKNLQKIMEREWENVRKGFYYPQLPQPRLVDGTPNTSIDIENLHIEVSEPFIKSFKEHDIDEPDSLNEVLTHELTHFMRYPGSVLNTLRLQKVGRKVTDAERVSQLRVAFTEAQTNIYMVNEREHPSTVAMRKVVQPDEGDGFGKLMYGLYQKVWGQDLGIELGEAETKLVDKLSGIDYLDKEDELDNFREFVQVLKDYQPPQQSGEGSKQGSGEGSQEGEGQSNGVGMFSDNQIREGLKQFAQECGNAEEFEEIVKQVLSEGEEKGKPQQFHGISAGTDKGITLLARNFYTALAEKYTIPIRKKPIKKNGGLYPNSHTGFSVSDSLNDLDSFSTPGILPGITKKWVKKEGEVATNFEAVPNSVLIVDNSPSMPNPEEGVSIPVLGATAVSTAYLDNDSKVAVYSFGSQDHFTNFSKNKEDVHRELRRYSVSGGTTFNPRFLEGILRESEDEFDISVVSDMDISNFGSFVDTVLGIPQVHRVHLLYTHGGGYAGKLRERFGGKENVAILPLLYESDVSKIVMGELRKSVR